jgi:hypothetical protein
VLHEPAGEVTHAPSSHAHPEGGPGEDFNQRADRGMIISLLERHGWTLVHHRHGTDYLRRPGKDGESWSATLGHVASNVLYVFSSNAHPFQAEHGYKPFSIYGLLEHRGDFHAAARALAAEGYGTARRQPGGHIGPEAAWHIARRLLVSLRETPDSRKIFNAIDILAVLPIDKWALFKSACKTILGERLNLNDLEKTRNAAQRRRLAQSTCEPTPQAPDGHGLPRVIVTNRPLRDVAEEALGHWGQRNQPPQTFVRTGSLIRVLTDEYGRPILDVLQEAHVRGALTRVADFITQRLVGGELAARHCSPPEDVVRDILVRGRWPFPPLEAIVEIPVMRPNGSILDTPGYDRLTRLYYHPAPGLQVPPIPTYPSRQDAEKARQFIWEAISEFPYVQDGPTLERNGERLRGSASAANAFAAVLTPVCRHLIDGCVPLGLIDKPKSGTGASLFTKLISLIGTGRTAAMMAAPHEDEEWRKSITATLMHGATVVVIDNVEQPLWAPSLAAALTATVWEDRVLGRNEKVRLPQRATWFATGNNLTLRGDLPRRCYWIRMDAKTARPWQRTGFTHPDLEAWVTSHRGELLAALLTIIRAWHLAGRPRADVPRLGGFEAWARTIGGILAFIGVPGFLGNLEALYEQTDEDTPQWEALVAAWWEQFREQDLTVADLVDEMRKPGSSLRAALPEHLMEAWPRHEDGWDSFRRKLGVALGKHVDVRYGPQRLYLTRDRDAHKKQARWRLARDVEPPHPASVNLEISKTFPALRDAADVSPLSSPRHLTPLARGGRRHVRRG